MAAPAQGGQERWPGLPAPLGARFDGAGTNFSVFSSMASAVTLCIDTDSGEERIPLDEVHAHRWHVYLPGVGPGTRYGYRVDGPWEPDHGCWCNPAKLLMDPYATAVDGEVDWDPAAFAYRRGTGLDGKPVEMDETDSAPFVPRSVVTSPYFDWGNDRSPSTPMHETVLYELHVKGFTQLHPDVPEPLRGTYAGLAHPAVIDHLVQLGVTAVELQPVHQFVHDAHLVEKGLRNYWGYNSIGFFAPHNGYRSADAPQDVVGEFKQMVRAFHDAGLEVILDVVYNHTAEGNHLGPILSFKGFDNLAYYRVMDDEPRYYRDYTGTGNTMNARNPFVLQLMMDSLRYWVTEMHVDGFRFDLAATLARDLHEVDRLSAFFDLIQQDPVTSSVKLIAEPWDVGEGGYQVGNFPPYWSEWNGRYRDSVRDFWLGTPGQVPELSTRLAGSSDLYANDAGRPAASINFITAHDGFTLWDLVSYEHKHNEANGEDNQDGTHDNRSQNCGVEGPTDDEDVLACRTRMVRNHLTTLLFSQGVPMLLGGDEARRTQDGNNNAYCQDSELTWVDWDAVAASADLLEETRRLVALRRDHPVLHRRHWLTGDPAEDGGRPDVEWIGEHGKPLEQVDWDDPERRRLGMVLNGDAITEPGPRGEELTDACFAILLNASADAVDWALPEPQEGLRWEVLVDSAGALPQEVHEVDGSVPVAAGAVVVLRSTS